MSLSLVTDSPGDPRNAEALSLASELAYLCGDEGTSAFKNKLALDGTLYSVGNTQAWVLHNDDHVVVAFRGTESPTSLDGIKDWLLTDAMNLLILPEGRLGTDLAAAGVGARFHMGFVNAIADIWDPVHEATEAQLKQKDRPLWLTGHSLGGSLAVLAAWLYLRKTIEVHEVYTFGGPMVGNEDAAQAINREFDEKIFRYVNLLDPVPLLPTISLASNSYAHCEKQMSPPDDGSEESSALGLFRSYASKAVEGAISGTLLHDFWDAIRSRLAAHNMDAYYALLKKLAGR